MVFLVLVLTIVVALVTWVGRAAAIRTHLRSRLVLALGATCTSALLATPVLATVALADYRSSGDGTPASSARARPSASAPRDSASPEQQEQSGALANTGGATTAPEAPVAATVCRNSTDPVCGPFRWDPAPGPNSPVEITITHSPSAPQTGEVVNVTVHVRDTDARIGDVAVTFGDEDVFTIPPASIISCEAAPPAGPWDSPAPMPDDIVRTFSHTYSRAGDLSIAAYAASPEILNATCPPHPYASQATASLPIHVNEG